MVRLEGRKKKVLQRIQRQELQAVGAGIFEIAPQERKATQKRSGHQGPY